MKRVELEDFLTEPGFNEAQYEAEYLESMVSKLNLGSKIDRRIIYEVNGTEVVD
jgi:hypothetical protein